MVARQRLDQPGAITGIARRLRSAERSAPLGFSSITRGGMRVESPDGIQVNTVAGGLPGLRVTGLEVVDGTLRITGTLEGGGTFSWTGTINQTGPTNLRGPVAITGESGTLTVDAETLLRGLTRMLADLRVEDGGKIIVTGGSSPATLQDGKMSFDTGGAVEADTSVGGVRLVAGDAVVNAGSVASLRKGSSSVIVGPIGIDINPAGDGDINMLGTAKFDRSTIPIASGTGLPQNVLFVNTSGYLLRSDGT